MSFTRKPSTKEPPVKYRCGVCLKWFTLQSRHSEPRENLRRVIE